MHLYLSKKDMKVIYLYLFALLEDKRIDLQLREEYLEKLRKDLMNNGEKNS